MEHTDVDTYLSIIFEMENTLRPFFLWLQILHKMVRVVYLRWGMRQLKEEQKCVGQEM